MARGDGAGYKGRPPNNLPMTFEQMVELQEERKPKKSDRRAYIEANKEEISTLVGALANRIEASQRKPKVDLRDTERVKEITLQYIRACSVSGTLPTIAGTCLALGVHADSVRAFRMRNPTHETSKWFVELRNQFGELLSQAALQGDVSPVPAIFTLKARYMWNDQPEIEAKDNGEAEEMSADTIAAKYEDLPS